MRSMEPKNALSETIELKRMLSETIELKRMLTVGREATWVEGGQEAKTVYEDWYL